MKNSVKKTKAQLEREAASLRQQLAALHRSVTERKRAAEGLQKSEAMLKQAEAVAHLGSWELDLVHGVLTWSEEIYRIFEINPVEFSASYEAFLDVIHSEDRALVNRAYTESVKHRTPYDVVHRLLMRDGRIKFVHERCKTFYDAQGIALRSIGTVQDITERKRVEQALRASEEEMRALFAAMTDVILVLDAEGRYLKIAPTNPALLYRPPDTLLGRTIHEVLPKPEADEILGHIRRALENKQTITVQYRLPIQEKETWFEGTVSPLNENSVFWVAHDITVAKQAMEALRESEKQQSLMLRSVPMVTYRARMTHPFGNTWISANTADISGFKPHAFLDAADFWESRLHPDDRERVVNAFDSIARTGSVAVEYRWQCADGLYRWFLDRAAVLAEEQGQPVEFIGTWLDITERKRTEEALLEMNVALLNAMPGISWLGPDGRYVKVNDAYSKMVGYEAGEMVGMDWTVTVSPDDLPIALAAYRQMLSEGKAEFEGRAVRKDGRLFHKQVWLVKRVDKEGHFLGHHCCMRDITERKLTDQALAAKTEQLQALTDAITTFLENEDWREASARILRAAVRQTQSQYGFIGVLAEGPVLRILAHEGMVWDPNVNRQFYESAVRQYQEKGFLEFTNFESLYGRVLTGRQTVVANEPASDPRSGGLPPGHPPLRHFLGVPIFRGTEVVGMIGVANRPGGYAQGDQDILAVLTQAASVLYDSYRRRLREADLQDQLRQSQKLEAIGRLAGGIAHDFNNILTPILSFTDLTVRALPEDSPSRPDLEQVLLAARRARELVKRILAFGRRDIGHYAPLSLFRLIEEMLPLLQASLPTTITFRPRIADTTALVRVDAMQMQQVLMNLCCNAEFAMRDTGGILELMLDNVPVDEAFAARHAPLQPGRHVRLTVRDSGCGMAPEVLPQIFDPFFTTKGPGEGSGLGLSMVHGIVIGHKGAITVASALGQGTTIEIYLPALEGAPPEEEQPQKTVAKGEARILFVDDEAAVLRSGERLLCMLGYTVTALDDSRQALEAFRAAPGQFDLVITDQTMPGLTGGALAAELLRIRPDLPIILCTGFSHTMTAEQAAARGIRAFMAKPYAVEDIAATIRRVLDRSTDNRAPGIA